MAVGHVQSHLQQRRVVNNCERYKKRGRRSSRSQHWASRRWSAEGVVSLTRLSNTSATTNRFRGKFQFWAGSASRKFFEILYLALPRKKSKSCLKLLRRFKFVSYVPTVCKNFVSSVLRHFENGIQLCHCLNLKGFEVSLPKRYRHVIRNRVTKKITVKSTCFSLRSGPKIKLGTRVANYLIVGMIAR